MKNPDHSADASRFNPNYEERRNSFFPAGKGSPEHIATEQNDRGHLINPPAENPDPRMPEDMDETENVARS